MRKNLLAIISAFICGILAMLIPLCVWYQINFPGEPFTLGHFCSQGTMGSSESYGNSFEDLSITPLYLAFLLSFSISMVAYALFKRRV